MKRFFSALLEILYALAFFPLWFKQRVKSASPMDLVAAVFAYISYVIGLGGYRLLPAYLRLQSTGRLLVGTGFALLFGLLFFTNNKGKWAKMVVWIREKQVPIFFSAWLVVGILSALAFGPWWHYNRPGFNNLVQDRIATGLMTLLASAVAAMVWLLVVWPSLLFIWRWLWGGEEFITQTGTGGEVKRFVSFEEAKASVGEGATILRHRWGLCRLLRGPSASVYYSDNEIWPIVRSSKRTVDIRLFVEDAARLLCFGGARKVQSIWHRSVSLDQEVQTLVNGLQAISVRLPRMDENGRSKWTAMTRNDLATLRDNFQTRLHGVSAEGIALFLERENPRPKPLGAWHHPILSQYQTEQEVARRHEEAREIPDSHGGKHRDFRRWTQDAPGDSPHTTDEQGRPEVLKADLEPQEPSDKVKTEPEWPGDR